MFLSQYSLLPHYSGHAAWSCVSWCPYIFVAGGGLGSIGVRQCNSSANLSSSLCPGQRAVAPCCTFHTVTLQPPTPPPVSLSAGSPTVLFLFALEFHLPARGQHLKGHFVCLCVSKREL